jgi:hypothetical protein
MMTWDTASAIAQVASAVAVVASLIYLARQLRMSNRLARAEAYRAPNSDLNSLNATFTVDAAFRAAFRKALHGATRDNLEPDEKTVLDGYLISVTNIYEQLAREGREGILDPGTLAFQARGLLQLPYYRTSWAFYRQNLSPLFVEEFEKLHALNDVSAITIQSAGDSPT